VPKNDVTIYMIVTNLMYVSHFILLYERLAQFRPAVVVTCIFVVADDVKVDDVSSAQQNS